MLHICISCEEREELEAKEAALERWQLGLATKSSSLCERELALQAKARQIEAMQTAVEAARQKLEESHVTKEEVELQMAELEAKLARRLSPGEIDPSCKVIFEMREELEFWRQGFERSRSMLSHFNCDAAQFFEDETLIAPMQRLLVATARSHDQDHRGQPSRCRPMSNAKVRQVLRVVNPRLWHQYAASVRQVSMQCDARGPPKQTKLSREMSLLSKEAFQMPCGGNRSLGAAYWIQLDEKANEVLLFHGTQAQNGQLIATTGFDKKRIRSGRYGSGFYFACEACKSFQYSIPDDSSSHHCIVVRVALGKARFTTTPLQGFKDEILGNSSHSVVVLPGSQGGPPDQYHHEFVIFDERQAFPEFIVYFDV